MYVWTAYAIALIVLCYNIINPMVIHRRFVNMQKQNLRRELARQNDSE